MQSMDWTSAHSDKLRELLIAGFSYARIAELINARFNTAYTRNATIGRAKRMGLGRPSQTSELPSPVPQADPVPQAELSSLYPLREIKPSRSWSTPPSFARTETAVLRCVEVDPRRVSLLELQHGDCRYPYGGDEEDEAITFCGHPRCHGTSYCVPHLQLTRVPADSQEAKRASATIAAIRLMEMS